MHQVSTTEFWRSDIPTGIQTEAVAKAIDNLFWRSDIPTGIQTRTSRITPQFGFGAVTFRLVFKPTVRAPA